MGVHGVSKPIDIAVSGLRSESARMKVIAGNIANSSTTRTPSGEPYRRQEVILSTSDDALGGVKIEDVASDMLTAFKRVHQPGHPDADADGFVRMPNVDLPAEIISLMSASKAYQANAAVLKRYQEMVNVALELLR